MRPNLPDDDYNAVPVIQKQFYSPCDEYIEISKLYTKTDAWLAVLACVVVYSFIAVGNILTFNVFVNSDSQFFLGYLITVVSVVIYVSLIIILAAFKRQSFLAFKINRLAALKSILAALGICVVLFLYLSITLGEALRPSLSSRHDNTSIWLIIFNQLVIVAFTEELIFRHYIAPRFYGVFDNKFVAILLVGFMFAFAHIVPIFITGMDSYIFLVPAIFMWMIYHFILHWLYSRFNSIWGPILLHFANNFLFSFVHLEYLQYTNFGG